MIPALFDISRDIRGASAGSTVDMITLIKMILNKSQFEVNAHLKSDFYVVYVKSIEYIVVYMYLLLF